MLSYAMAPPSSSSHVGLRKSHSASSPAAAAPASSSSSSLRHSRSGGGGSFVSTTERLAAVYGCAGVGGIASTTSSSLQGPSLSLRPHPHRASHLVRRLNAAVAVPDRSATTTLQQQQRPRSHGDQPMPQQGGAIVAGLEAATTAPSSAVTPLKRVSPKAALAPLQRGPAAAITAPFPPSAPSSGTTNTTSPLLRWTTGAALSSAFALRVSELSAAAAGAAAVPTSSTSALDSIRANDDEEDHRQQEDEISETATTSSAPYDDELLCASARSGASVGGEKSPSPCVDNQGETETADQHHEQEQEDEAPSSSTSSSPSGSSSRSREALAAALAWGKQGEEPTSDEDADLVGDAAGAADDEAQDQDDNIDHIAAAYEAKLEKQGHDSSFANMDHLDLASQRAAVDWEKSVKFQEYLARMNNERTFSDEHRMIALRILASEAHRLHAASQHPMRLTDAEWRNMAEELDQHMEMHGPGVTQSYLSCMCIFSTVSCARSIHDNEPERRRRQMKMRKTIERLQRQKLLGGNGLFLDPSLSSSSDDEEADDDEASLTLQASPSRPSDLFEDEDDDEGNDLASLPPADDDDEEVEEQEDE